MAAYYNEHDPKAAAWIRELIKQGHIADGVVDERSIEDVLPNELAGFTQCHFFAGIAVWSYALRRAGWPDDRAVWTGSCPCQPFSAAGKGDGFADERHLWPAWFQLIAQCRPAVVLGEQVASKDGLNWLDLVYADLEDAGYSVGAADLCAAGVGAPHIRQRLWFVADTGSSGLWGRHEHREHAGPAGDLRGEARQQRVRADHGADGTTRGMANAQRPGLEVRADANLCGTVGYDEGRLAVESGHGGVRGSGPADCNWPAPDWIFCRDGKWRPVEAGTFPLVDGAAERVGLLRGYGNAICAPAAEAFVSAYLEGLI